MLFTGLAELVDGIAEAPLLDKDGAPLDPLVVVDLGSGPVPDAAALAAAARRTPRLLVGLGVAHVPCVVLDAMDVTLVPGLDGDRRTVGVDDPRSALSVIASTVAAAPRAATVLTRLLRWTGDLSVADALDVESLAYSTLLGGPEFRRWLDTRGPRPLPPVVAEPVLLARDGDVLSILLNRPERRNAYGRQVRDALVEALGTAVLDPDIARVVVSGAGPCFCAGGDLDEFGRTPDVTTAHLVRTLGGAALTLHGLAGRVEVRVHGRCVGAGVELPCFAGRVVGAPETSFRLPELSMGLIPGAGGTVSLPRRVGRWRTLYLALSGMAISVERAQSWGLVDETLGFG